ncbi:MAG: glucose-6-phosphate dehydrogenase assembly protein OpcA [Deltaproteobacteria bacterium]|nr:glucose-6-phosphate dehydrogenase assembly protein OpcA [Deltaproteobacteria bacterium]
MNVQTPVTTSGQVHVNPAEIERELLRVWRETAALDMSAQPTQGAERDTRVRAILSNFVIISRADDQTVPAGHIDDIVTAMCVSYPSRFFILRCGDVNGPELDTSVSSRCVLARSGAHVCSEELHVRASEAGLRFVPNLLRSLYAADVPVVLLLVGDALGGTSASGVRTLIRTLEAEANMTVFDSGNFADFGAGLNVLKDATGVGLDDVSSRALRRDLNWYRLERWRVLIAEQFDAERYAQGVTNISRVRLTCAVEPKMLHDGFVPSESLLLGAWFSIALGWEISGRGRNQGSIQFTPVSGGPSREITFLPSDVELSAVNAGRTTDVEIEIESGAGTMFLAFSRNLSEGSLHIATENSMAATGVSPFCDFSTMKVPFRVYQDEDLLPLPLHSGARDTLFPAVCGRAGEMSRLLRETSS